MTGIINIGRPVEIIETQQDLPHIGTEPWGGVETSTDRFGNPVGISVLPNKTRFVTVFAARIDRQ